MKSSNIDIVILLCQIQKWAIYLATFLLPLFFLPFTSSPLEFNKQTLLLFLVSVGILVWFLKSILEGKISLPFHWIYLPFAAFFLAALASASFSFYSYGSFWGYPLKTSQAFFTLLGFGLYFLLIILFLTGRKIQKQEESRKLFLTLIASGVVAAILGLLNLYQQFFLPWNFARAANFNTAGSLNSWAVFLGAMVPLTSVMIFLRQGRVKWFFAFSLIVFLFGLLAANFWAAWIVALAGLAVTIPFGLLSFQERRSRIILPLVLFAAASLFGIFRLGLVIVPSAPLEVSPTYGHTLDIAVKTIQERPVTGSGPGTFVYDYAKHRADSINQTAFWNTRFINGASELFEWLATMGILGLLAFLILIFSFIYIGLKTLLRESSGENSDDQLLLTGALSLFIGAFSGFLLYRASLPLEMMFALSGAMILVFSAKYAKAWDLNSNKLAGTAISLIFILVVIGILGLLFEQSKRYAAELHYAASIEAAAANNSQEAFARSSRAVQLNTWSYVYWRDISQLALGQLALALREASALGQNNQELPQAAQDKIQNFFNLAVASANRAVQISPNDGLNWLNRGEVYRNLIGLAQGAFQQSVSSYQKARELEPKNPEVSLRLAIANLTQAQSHLQLRQQTEANNLLSQAMEELDKAIALKNNFWAAYFQQAVVLDAQGELDQAIAKLEEIKPFNQQDAGLAFQLGSYYFRQEDLTKARREFERALRISPNFANALYFLGLIHDRQGDKAKAIEQFEKIAEFSDSNAEQVKFILENLKAGLPALAGQQEVQEVPQLEE